MTLACALVAVERDALSAQEPACSLLCAPALKLEPTITFENLGRRARIERDGIVERSEREAVFELILALDVPTSVPRVGLSLEAIMAPFGGSDEHPFTGATAEGLGREEIRDNVVELEAELNLELFDEERTGGWISSHVDVVDKFSPGERPRDGSAYTHKLDFEWDTALHAFAWLPPESWLHNVELEVSLDYLATGLPQAGDAVGGELYLDDASPWSLSLVLVAPLAPLRP